MKHSTQSAASLMRWGVMVVDWFCMSVVIPDTHVVPEERCPRQKPVFFGWGMSGVRGFFAPAALLAAVILGPSVFAQGGGALAPSPSQGLAAFEAVEGWVRGMVVHPLEDELAGRIGEVTGVHVVIRGREGVIGRGTAFGDGCLERASEGAIEEAIRRVRVPVLANREQARRLVIASARISVEIAGAMVPVRTSLDSWSDVHSELSLGLEGLGVRAGERFEGVFPSSMAMARRDGGTALAGLVSRAIGDPLAAAKLPGDVGVGAEDGPALFRFRVAHIAQTRAGGPPVVLHRGGRVLHDSLVGRDELVGWADAMAAWLLRRAEVVGRVERLGVYDPFTDTWRDGGADGSGHPVVAAALERYASLPGVDAELAARARALLDARAVRLGVEEDAVRPWASWWWTGFGLDVDDADRRRVRAAFLEAGPGGLVNEMPWLGFEELRISRRLQRVPSAVALRDMRALMWEHTVRDRDVGVPDRDLVGGLVFTSRRNPVPDWQSARPLAFGAAMLADPRLTEDREFASELADLLTGLRFLRQLTAGDEEAHAYRVPLHAIGGVRASLTDHSMPSEAAGYALLAVSESLAGLDAAEARLR